MCTGTTSNVATTTDEQYLKRAIQLARDNVLTGGRPFGTVIVRNGEVIAEGQNITHVTNDPSDHAETVAVRIACKKLARPTLEDCDVFAIGHPCPMCMSLLLLSKPRRVVFAATLEQKAEGGIGQAGLIYDELKKPFSERSVTMQHLDSVSKDAMEVFRFFQEHQQQQQQQKQQQGSS